MNALRALFPALLLAGVVYGDERPVKEKDPADAPAAAEVSGTVTLNGKPLPAGWIVFHRQGGKDVRATIDEGKYQLKNVPTGAIKITIDVNSIAPTRAILSERLQALMMRAALLKAAKKDDEELTKRIEEMKGRVKVFSEMEKKLKGLKIPEKYRGKETTPLTATVKKGVQELNIELEK